MAWKKVKTTLGEQYSSKQIDELFEDFYVSNKCHARDKFRLTEGKNFMNLKSYADEGIAVAVELGITNDQFNSAYSELPKILSGVETFESKDKDNEEYRRVELNLGRTIKDTTGEDVNFLEHVGYLPYEKKYLISVVFPDYIKRKIEIYGDGAMIDGELPEAQTALLISDAVIKEGFEAPKQEYMCTKPACPIKLADKEELIELIKRSTKVKLEANYFKGGRIIHDIERVLIDMAPDYISIDGLSDIKPELNDESLLKPFLKSTQFEFSPSAELEYNEKYTGLLKSGYRSMKNLGEDKGTFGKIYRAGKGTAELGSAIGVAPFAVAYLIGDSL